MSRIVDAAIIGAGLAGSCLAKELADRGWSSLLLDSARFPRHKVCGEFVSPEARSTLLRAGLLEYVEALQPVRIERIRIVLSTGETLDVPLPGAAMGVSRYALDPALHRAVSESGAEVLTGTTVTSIERSDAGFRITAKQGRHKPEQAAEAEGSAAHSDDSKEWQAKVVIAAWGANRRPVVFRRGLQTANAGVSFVQVADSVEAAAGQGQARVSMGGRKPLIESGIQTAAGWWQRGNLDPGRSGMDPGSGGHRADRSRQSSHVEANSYVGVKSHYAGVDMEPAVELYFFPGGYVGIAPVAAGTVNVAALLRRSFAGGAGHAGGSVPALLAAAARAHPQLARRLAEAQPLPGTQAAVAPVAPGRAPAAAWGGLPLVGDAALMVPPLCGDGMSIALRSACLCAPLADRCLRGAITPAQWERQYALLLRRELAGPLRWGGLLQTLAEGRLAPRLLLRAAHLWPGLAAALVRATRLRDAGGGPDAR